MNFGLSSDLLPGTSGYHQASDGTGLHGSQDIFHPAAHRKGRFVIVGPRTLKTASVPFIADATELASVISPLMTSRRGSPIFIFAGSAHQNGNF